VKGYGVSKLVSFGSFFDKFQWKLLQKASVFFFSQLISSWQMNAASQLCLRLGGAIWLVDKVIMRAIFRHANSYSWALTPLWMCTHEHHVILLCWCLTFVKIFSYIVGIKFGTFRWNLSRVRVLLISKANQFISFCTCFYVYFYRKSLTTLSLTLKRHTGFFYFFLKCFIHCYTFYKECIHIENLIWISLGLIRI